MALRLSSLFRETSEEEAGVATSAVTWVVVAVPVVVWELFLRFDSQVVTPVSRACLLGLGGAAILATAGLIGATLGAILARVVGPPTQRRLAVVALVFTAAAAFAAEFAGVVHYHDPELIPWWPLVAFCGALVGFAADIGTRRVKRAVRPSTSRGAALAALAGIAVIIAACVSVDRYPGWVPCVARANTIVGRATAMLLEMSQVRLPQPSQPALVLPDRPARQPLPRGNVFLISVDALRADVLSPYGAAVSHTPQVAHIAERAVVFEDAFAVKPTSAPSMASLLTGRYPAGHGVRDNRIALPPGIPTLAEMLAGEGYATAGFVTNPNFSSDFGFQRGFATYHYRESGTDADGLVTDSTDPEVVDEALAWTREHIGQRLFVWVHVNAPHSPYLPPLDLRPALRPGAGPWFNVLNMPGHLARVEGLRTYFDRGVYRALYEAEVASMDRQVGRLIQGLAALGVLDDAHVILLADHGEAFGEGDDFGHGGSLHHAETRVPLLWQLPGSRRGGARVKTTVDLVDVLPTLWNLTGHERPPAVDGRIVSGILLGEEGEDPGFAFSEAGWPDAPGASGLQYAVRTRERSVWFPAASPSFLGFDRSIDEAEDRAHRYQPSADDELFGALIKLTASSRAGTTAEAQRIEVDPHQRERLRALGYVR